MIEPGQSAYPPLSPERIAAARARHGHGVDEYLAHLRLGDPLADDLVACFADMPSGAGQRLLLRALDHGIEAVENPPAPLTALFRELDHVPFWVNWERARGANAKILRNGVQTGLVFALYALPHSYLASANRPLAFTGRLVDQTARRYARTARFVVETFMPSALDRHADGFRTAVLVRMSHARVRRQILQSPDWDAARFGVPLNQAHMALNSVYFSFYVVKGMQRLGVRFNRNETEGLLLIWRYVNYLFGINPEMVCTSEEEAERLIRIAFSVECDPDEATRILSAAKMKASEPFLDFLGPRVAKLFVSLLYPLSRRLLGDRLADRFGYPPERRRFMCWLVFTGVYLLDRFPGLFPRAFRAKFGVTSWLEWSDFEMDR